MVRSLVYPAANRGVARRLLDHTAFAASALASGRWAGTADVVVAETPPLFLAAAAPAYARRRGAALVLHVSDLWPDSAIALGAVESPTAIRLARALERHAYRGAARVVVPTRGLERELAGRDEVAERVRRIGPAVDLDRFAAPPPRRDGALRVLYAGTVGMAHGVETLVEAARRAGPAVEVTIAGAGADLERVRAAVAAVDNVRVLGAVAATAVPGLLRETDVAAVLLRDRAVFRDALPTKLLEAMAAGRPLALSAAGEAAELVERSGAGVVAAPEDPDALADALLGLAALDEVELRALGERGVAHASGCGRGAMVERWAALLADVVGARTASR